MPAIHVLKKEIAELIAAGEVIERPASIVKELLENAIDAGATSVTVEIKNGGVSYIRVTDNGCGIAREDVPKAFLRHATSKVSGQRDLESISTLGFRGEALASICAVARVELLTKTPASPAGTRYVISGGEEETLEEAGCPDGTTILVRDVFYNVPARLKFLKKDFSESNAVAAVMDKIALSHPEISVRFIRDNKQALHTPGDNTLYSAVYAVFGREFAESLTPVEYTAGSIRVRGFASIPMNSRTNRSMQHFFVNGRYVKTRTAMAALEEGYKGAIMVGKFPACVLQIDMPFDQVDVNVHPAKIEVRFVNEKPVFEAVYFAVKSALRAYEQKKLSGDDRPLKEHVPRSYFKPSAGEQTRLTQPARPFASAQQKTAENTREKEPPSLADRGTVEGQTLESLPLEISRRQEYPYLSQSFSHPVSAKTAPPRQEQPAPEENRSVVSPRIIREAAPEEKTEKMPAVPEKTDAQTAPEIRREQEGQPPLRETAAPAAPKEQAGQEPVRVIGELFKTYILAQQGSQFILMDKHAAHERILYEKLKTANGTLDRQVLLKPFTVLLSREEYVAALENSAALEQLGFAAEDFGDSTLLVREIPVFLNHVNADAVFREIVDNLALYKKDAAPGALEDLFHSIACRAAVKANDESSLAELTALFMEVYNNENIRYCPHGRPVMLIISKERLEKQFGR